jgi:predicted peptidase
MIRTAELFTSYPGDKGTRYYQYVPTAGSPRGVVLFLHGQGEIGTDLTKVEHNELPKMLDVDGVRGGTEMPFMVLAPQEEPPQEWYGRAITVVHIAESKNLGKPHYTGLSLGAMCFDNVASDLGDAFQSVALVAGSFEDYNKQKAFDVLKKIPSVFYYGDQDTQIPYGYTSTKKMYDALKAAGADTTFINYPGRGHDIWPDAYAHYVGWLNTKFSGTTPPPPLEEPVTEIKMKGQIISFKSATGKTIEVSGIIITP